MTKYNRSLFLGISAAVLIASPALAQETVPDPAVVRLNAEATQLEAQAKLETAKAALLQAKLAPLTALKTESKTELGQDAASMEATILSTAALQEAATILVTGKPTTAKKLGANSASKYLVLADGETIQTDTYAAVSSAFFGIRQQLKEACKLPAAKCVLLPPPPTPSVPSDLGGGVAAVVSTLASLVGLLGSEIKLGDLKATATSKMFARAVAGKFNGNAFFKDAIALPDLTKAPLLEVVEEVYQLRSTADVAAQNIAKIKKPTAPQKAAKAALDAAVKRYDDYFAKITTVDDKGVATLAVAFGQSFLSQGDYRLLRVGVEKAGGTSITRKNLFVLLGIVPAVGVSGGLLVSWDESDPKTGQIMSAGTIACTAGFARIKHIQAQQVKSPVCN